MPSSMVSVSKPRTSRLKPASTAPGSAASRLKKDRKDLKEKPDNGDTGDKVRVYFPMYLNEVDRKG